MIIILQYNINREAAKISALSSNKLPSNQKQIIEQARFTYFPLGKTFEKQIKTIEYQGKKQIETLKGLKPEGQKKSVKGIFLKCYENVEITNNINKIKEYEKKVNRNNMIFQAKNHSILKHLKQ